MTHDEWIDNNIKLFCIVSISLLNSFKKGLSLLIFCKFRVHIYIRFKKGLSLLIFCKFKVHIYKG